MDYKKRKNICITILVISIIGGFFSMIQYFDSESTANVVVEENASTTSGNSSTQSLYSNTDLTMAKEISKMIETAVNDKVNKIIKDISIVDIFLEKVKLGEVKLLTYGNDKFTAFLYNGTILELSKQESEENHNLIIAEATTNNVPVENITKEEKQHNDKMIKLLWAICFGFMVLLSFICARLIKKYSEKCYEINGKQIEINAGGENVNVPDVCFDDLQGCEEIKENIQGIVSCLKDPEKLSKVGARMPKGLVLYGPPGTGKTLTAKAIAGEAGVPFFSVSGSDFIEMYVGVGAKRVRDLYKVAHTNAPCIVFIDEIDAVGAKRGDGHNSERDQTINALLTELDGFDGAEGIFTICATNRLDMLDPALIRSGRFDLQLAVPLPDRQGRLSILKRHAENKSFEESVDFELLASKTINFSGADLEALLNEAAMNAVKDNKEKIDNNDVEEAFYKIVMKGNKKKDQSLRNSEELKLVAWHESGHAIVSKLLAKEEVSMVSIISSTSGAGGVTFRNPKETNLYSKKHLENLIKVTYGGRAAEEVYYGNNDDITTGASNDIKQATEMIYNYICTYGMKDNCLLNISCLTPSGKLPDNIINDMSDLSKQLYEETVSFLKNNSKLLKDVAEQLLEKENLTDDDLNKIIKRYKINI